MPLNLTGRKNESKNEGMNTIFLVIASLVFNLLWFVAVMGQDTYASFLALSIVIFFFIYPQSIMRICLIALIGICGDRILNFEHIIQFESDTLPIWLVLLWFIFACYLWLIRATVMKVPLMILLVIGPVGGLLCYLAGEQLEAVVLSDSVFITYGAILVFWFVYSLLFYGIFSHEKVKEGHK